MADIIDAPDVESVTVSGLLSNVLTHRSSLSLPRHHPEAARAIFLRGTAATATIAIVPCRTERLPTLLIIDISLTPWVACPLDYSIS